MPKERPPSDDPPDLSPEQPDLSPEQEENARQMAHDLSEARNQLLEAEVSTVIANHALGMYELAALHISAETPDLAEVRLAIDALGVLTEGLAGRLGEGEPMLIEALANVKLAYVQRAHQLKQQGQSEQPVEPEQPGQSEQEAEPDQAEDSEQ